MLISYMLPTAICNRSPRSFCSHNVEGYMLHFAGESQVYASCRIAELFYFDAEKCCSNGVYQTIDFKANRQHWQSIDNTETINTQHIYIYIYNPPFKQCILINICIYIYIYISAGPSLEGATRLRSGCPVKQFNSYIPESFFTFLSLQSSSSEMKVP